VGSTGDLDGDEINDFIIGARSAEKERGVLYIVSGKQVIESSRKGKFTDLEMVSLLKLIGKEEGDLLGWSCADINADIDGDGISEISVGARGANGYIPNSGVVYIVPGSWVRDKIMKGIVTASVAASPILKIGADHHGARLGSKRRFSNGGDFDLDGINDLVLGTPGLHEGGIFAGAVWLIPGSLIKIKLTF